MEKCTYSLQDWIDKNKAKRIDKNTFINIALQILHAIEYLHQNHYVLNNLSLRNILIDDKNTVKLYNFGLKKEIDTSVKSATLISTKNK